MKLQFRRKSNKNTDGGVTASIQDKRTTLAFVDQAGNTLPNTDFARLYYFDQEELSGAIQASLSWHDNPEGATIYNGTLGNQLNINLDGSINTAGNGQRSDAVVFADDVNNIIILETNLGTTGTVSAFSVFTGNGDDSFSLGGTLFANTRVYTEEGNDSVVVNTVTGLQGLPIIVDLGAGDDTFNSTWFGGANLYGCEGDDTITIGDSGYGAEKTILDLGAGNDTLVIDKIEGTGRTEITAGAGDDKITIETWQSGSLTVDGGADADTLNIEFTSINLNNVLNVETINLNATNQTTATLSGTNWVSTVADGTNATTTITINGNAGDILDLGRSGQHTSGTQVQENNAWIESNKTWWTQGADENGYHTYTYSENGTTVKVLVEDSITVY